MQPAHYRSREHERTRQAGASIVRAVPPDRSSRDD